MPTLNALLLAAQQRANDSGLSYSGTLHPQEASYLSEHAPGAVIVDVRSQAERDLVGFIDKAVAVEWQTYPDWQLNPYFISQLKAAVDTEALVMFICRSGVRSHHAATAAQLAGYGSAYNIAEGFEGEKDKSGHRGSINGWKAAALSWAQK